MGTITFDQFMDVDIRVGKIIKVEDFPEARKPAYKLWIDFGELGEKKTSAQITKLYNKEDLLGKYIVAVVNFPPKQIANFMSEVLVLGAVNGDEVTLISPDNIKSREDILGKRIS